MPLSLKSVAPRLANASEQGVDAEPLDCAALRERFPYLSLGEGARGMYEHSGGWVSARGMVEAQCAAAAAGGNVDFVEEQALSVEPDGAGGFVVTTVESGQRVRARRVLVAAGALSNARVPHASGEGTLLPRGVELDVALGTAQVVRFRLAPADAKRLRGMPSLVYRNDDFWCYVLPPITYPDGHVYIKLGGARHADAVVRPPGVAGAHIEGLSSGKRVLRGPAEVRSWCESRGDPDAARAMERMLRLLVPGLEPLEVISDACVTTSTVHGQCYIGGFENCFDVDGMHSSEAWRGASVAVGGNGGAAKSSDELGRLAALAALAPDGTPEWDPETPPALRRELFAPAWRKRQTIVGCDGRARACIVAMVGLPGAGKSAVSRAAVRALRTLRAEADAALQVRVVAADDFMQAARNDGASSPAEVWKTSRQLALEAAEETLAKWDASGGVGVLVVDDNHFYGSMRRVYRRLCRAQRAAFTCAFVDAPPEVCLARDALREGNAHVGESAVRRMASALEPPSEVRDACPVLRLGSGDTASDASAMLGTRLAEWVAFEAWGEPPPLLPEDNPDVVAQREADAATTAASAVHLADIRCRKVIGESMAAVQPSRRKDAAATLNGARKETMAEARAVGEETGFAADVERLVEVFRGKALRLVADGRDGGATGATSPAL